MPVRFVNFKGVDMDLFRFDYDLTFAVLMMNPDGKVYSRFGTQDWRGSTERMSLAGLKRAMRAVLATHRGAAGGLAPARQSSRPRTLEAFPAFARTKQAKDPCYHCHYANNARFAQLRAEGKFSKEMLFQYPYPENIGLRLDPDAPNVVQGVLPRSAAEAAGVRKGDVIRKAGGRPVHTDADLQFALDPVPDPGSIVLAVERAGNVEARTLKLPRGWRRTDISWRPSQGDLPPTVGVWAEPLSEEQKRRRDLPAEGLALRVSFLFPGPQWARTRGSLQMNDVIVDVNGASLKHMTTRQFHSYFRLAFNVGDQATLSVLRGAQRLEIPVPCLPAGD